MIRLYDWLWLAITWAALLLAVAGLFIAASEWKRRRDSPLTDVDDFDDLG